ncbi:bifunctional lysylphosphatidylglycerol flippase/synthetase MprF [Terrabacter terrigena]|uniref:Bifunctional lysylphosphatidylglycerol flippase/synthetase MprF n=1 Tax=Terrabacter terrigena TaxID=574718 RepID=A0ABW3MXH3_9MICO
MPRPRTVMRRLPLTSALLAVVLALSVVTRTLWDPLLDRLLRTSLTYGLPAFESGDWWTVLTGAFFAPRPLQYVPILVGLAVFGGFAEWRLGPLRYAVALATCHLVGVLGSAGLLWLTRDHGYLWSTTLSHVRDAGPSAAFLGAAAAASVTVAPPWRGRLRTVLTAYVVLFVIHLGGLADLEHVLAVGWGLLLGPVLVGRAPALHSRQLTRRDFRLLASGFFVVAAVEGLIQPFTTADGPLTATLSAAARAEALADRNLLVGVVLGTLWLILARSLYKGRRRAWRWAVGLLVLVIGIQLANVGYVLATAEQGLLVACWDLVGNAFGLGVLLVGRHAFRNPSRRRARRTTGSLVAPADDGQREQAVALLREQGTGNRLAWMTTWPENRWFTDERESGYIAYRVHAGVVIGLCDPVAGTQRERAALLGAFSDTVHAQGLVPCLFTVTSEVSAHARARGWHCVQVAEEAWIELPTLDFVGKAWQDVRTALNQAAKLGVVFRLGPLVQMPRGIQMQVKAISSEWVEDKGLPEMGFTLGGVDEALDPDVRVGLAVDDDGTVHGVTSWMPVHEEGGGDPTGWTLDVMRRLPGGFRYSMEFLIASACLAFKEEGCAVVSLSGAPLARTVAQAGDEGLDRGTIDTFLDRLGATLEPYYGFRSLHAFKAKFKPRHEPLHLVFPDEAALPRIGLALTRAYLPEAGVRDLVALARTGH